MNNKSKANGCLTSWITIVFFMLFLFPIFVPVGVILLVIRSKRDKKAEKERERNATMHQIYGMIISGNLRNLSALATMSNSSIEETREIVLELIEKNVLQGALWDESRGMVVLPNDVGYPQGVVPQMYTPAAPVECDASTVDAAINEQSFEGQSANAMQSFGKEGMLATAQMAQGGGNQGSTPVSGIAPKESVAFVSTTENPMQQALKKTKKQLICFFAISVSVAILGFVLSAFVAFFAILGILGLLCAVCSAILFPGAIQQIKRNFCKKCGQRYDYEQDIAFDQEDVAEEGTRITATVAFECQCHHCGEEQQFRRKFTIATYDKNKCKWRYDNLEKKCKNYFKMKY